MKCQMLIRTFISVDVPITEEISSLLKTLRDIKGIRVPPEGQIHLTLKFLGDTDDRKVTRLCASLREALSDSSSFDVNIAGLGAFPNERNPRVLWMGVKEPEELIGLADVVDETVGEEDPDAVIYRDQIGIYEIVSVLLFGLFVERQNLRVSVGLGGLYAHEFVAV